jgi:ABC-type antimicrobial peptide transport system permease subunit
VRGLGTSFLVRRARSSWLLLSCVAVTVLLTTGLAAAGWTFAAGAVPAGALSILAAPQGRSIALSGPANAGKAASDSRFIGATLRKAWPGVGFRMDSALWADPIQLASPASAGPAGCPPAPVQSSTFPGCSTPTVSTQIQPASLEGISAEASLTAGRWPGPPRPGGPLPVALPAAAASRLHLRPGSVFTGTTSSGAPASLQVTGLFRARNPASPYWGLDLLPVSGVAVNGSSISRSSISYPGISQQTSYVSYGPAVVNPAAFGGTLTASQASWLVLPQAPPMARGNIDALAASTSSAASRLAVAILPYGLKVTSSLPQTLAGIASTIVLTRSLFTIGALELLLVAGAGLVLAARLLASLREEESALLRARGATRWQVAQPVLAEAVLLGAAAGLAGVLAGTRLTGVLADLGHLRLDGSPGRGIPSLAWLSALAMLVLCAAVMAWPALRILTPDAARRRRGRQARLAGIAWAGADVAMVALAAVAVWQLRGYSVVAHPSTGSLGIDPVVAVAPALALAGVTLIPLRGLPLLARLADKATDRERRLAAAMVSWQIARRPIRQAGPALLVVVATATTTLGLAGYASWRQSTADQAAFAVGSDVRVDSAAPLSLGTATSISRAPGVTAATPASLASLGSAGQMIALDASTAGQAILLRPDLSPLPLSALWPRITPRRPSGLALPGQPDRLEILASLGAGPHTSAPTVRQQLGSATVTAWIQAADGATYEIPAAVPLPFDGRPHSLVFRLSGPRQASYPLRLLGLTLTYTLPPYDPARPPSAPAARLSVASLAVAAGASGPFGRPFARGAVLAAWRGTGSSAYVPTGPPNPYGSEPPSDGAAPAILGWQRTPGAGQQLTFNSGHEPSAAVMLAVNLGAGIATGQVTVAVKPPAGVIPAIATSGYLAAHRLGIGSAITVSLNGFPVTMRVAASVARFPAVLGPNRALIADLAGINDLLAAYQVTPLPVTRWWLRTAGGRVPRMPSGLGLSVTDRASQQAALLRNPLLTAPRQAMLAIGAAAVLLGVLGFSISGAASLRARRTQSAVFAALGVGKNAQARQLCLEQCALSLPAAAAGLLAGLGLAQLMVPAITLTADAAAPVPSALVIVPLGPAVALALITAVVPTAATALSVLRRPDPAARLRAEAV